MTLNKGIVAQDLSKIGIKKGDVLYVKASMREIGEIEGGAEGFIDILTKQVGTDGTIILSAFIDGSIIPFNKKNVSSYYNKTLPTYNGIISSKFLQHNDVVISKHPMFRYALWGKYAKELSIYSDVDSSPYELLEIAATKYNAKALVIGERTIGYGTTHISLKIAMKKNNYFQKKLPLYLYYNNNEGKVTRYMSNQNFFCANSFRSLREKIGKDIIISQEKIGNANSYLIDMNLALLHEHKLLNSNIENILCDNPLCYFCRLSFSFTKRKYMNYIFQQKEGIVKRIKIVVRHLLLAKNTQ